MILGHTSACRAEPTETSLGPRQRPANDRSSRQIRKAHEFGPYLAPDNDQTTGRWKIQSCPARRERLRAGRRPPPTFYGPGLLSAHSGSTLVMPTPPSLGISSRQRGRLKGTSGQLSRDGEHPEIRISLTSQVGMGPWKSHSYNWLVSWGDAIRVGTVRLISCRGSSDFNRRPAFAVTRWRGRGATPRCGTHGPRR